MTIRVLLADDQHLVRSGFRLILSVEDDIEVVGEAADGIEAVQRAEEHRPDVVLMDVQMPRMDGIDAARRIVDGRSGRVIMLTTFDRDDYLFSALEAGATGFLLKNADAESLVDAVRRAAEGHALLAPEVTLRVIHRMTEESAPVSSDLTALRDAGVTEREHEVLVLVGEGLSNAEIAGRLHLGAATVKTHVSNCLAKLHLRDRVQAVVWAHRHGLVPAGE